MKTAHNRAVDSHFLAGVIRPFFWLLVMLPFLVLLRWLLGRYVRPHLSPRWQQILFRKVTD